MPTQDRPYDIRLDGKPYMLAREGDLADGEVAWATGTVGSAITQQTSEESRYSHLAPAVETAMVWNSFHRGFGDEENLDSGRYYYSQNMDCRFEGKAFPCLKLQTLDIPTDSVRGNVIKFVEMRNLLFAFNERYALFIDPVQNTVVRQYDFGEESTITDACAFGGDIIVGRGYADTAYSYSLTMVARWGGMGFNFSRWGEDGAAESVYGGEEGGAVWAEMPGVAIGYMTPFKDRLNASTSEYTVRWCAQSPQIQGNWTAEYRIGDSGQNITALAELGEQLYVGKRNGLYALGSDGYAIQIAPELGNPAHNDNCAAMKAWHGMLWVPHQRGLFAYRSLGDSGFSVTSCSLGTKAGQSSPVRGTITALAGDDRWLYAAVWTGTDTYLLAGREPRAGEEAYSPILWHTLAYLPGERVYTMHIGATGLMPRLYLAAGNGILFMELPYGTDNPLQDESCTYETGTHSLYLPRHSLNAPSTRKLFKSVEILADRLQPSQYIDVYYRLDNARTWRPVGGREYDTNRATRSPRHVLAFEPDGIAGRRIEFRLDIHCSSGSRPPILRGVVVRAAERPKTQEVITAIIKCADNLPNRTNGRYIEKGETMLARLKELADAGRAVWLEDLIGYKRRVTVLAPIEERTARQEGTLAREIVATVRMTPFQAEEMETLVGAWRWGHSKWSATRRPLEPSEDAGQWMDARQ